MSRSKLPLILGVIFFCINPIGIFAFDYVINDFTFYSIPNIPRPPKGVPFQDPVFHTGITRITDAPTDVPGSKANYASTGYPKHNIENADGTKLIIQSTKYPDWHIWNANPPYNKIKDIPNSLVGDIDPDVRWDATDPAILYSTYGSKLYKFNISTTAITLLYDFQKDFSVHVARAYTAEEGVPSADSRYWALRIRCA